MCGGVIGDLIEYLLQVRSPVPSPLHFAPDLNPEPTMERRTDAQCHLKLVGVSQTVDHTTQSIGPRTWSWHVRQRR